jgi:hypothetical protein
MYSQASREGIERSNSASGMEPMTSGTRRSADNLATKSTFHGNHNPTQACSMTAILTVPQPH